MSWALPFWDANSLNSDFEKIRQNKCTLYIHKQFANDSLVKGLLAGEEKLRQLYVLKPIPSSESTCVDKFSISVGDDEREIYLKQYLCGSPLRFIKSVFRRSRARRAFEAALMLARNSFDTSEVVAMGERRDGFFHRNNFLATFAAENSKAIYQLIPENSKILDKEQLRSWRQLIRALGRTIGKMHADSIFHGDLRLGNILARRKGNHWRLFFIDNERTKKFHRLPFKLRLKNLVQVNMVPAGNTSNTDRMRFFREYCAENKISKRQSKLLAEKVLKKTNQRLNKEKLASREIRKCLRTNARYLRIKTDRYVAVFNRGFWRAVEPLDFVEQIDALMDKGQILKNGDTSYVSRITWNGKDVAVKRYNRKGFVHSLRHTIKGSRARRCWLNGHRLMALNIPTPKPIAFIEQRKGMLLWKSYLVTEYSVGRNLHHFLQDDTVAETQKSMMVQQVTKLLDKLQKYRVSHGDMKHTNILVTDNGPVLTDLDGMKPYRSNLIYRRRQTQDVARFLEKLQK
jgi:tRNA A-37 threonylcarbamoyl transferase component Bud32